MDAQDKAAFVAAIGVSIFCKDETRRVQCTLHSSCSPLALQPERAMQHHGQEEFQYHREQQQEKQQAIRMDLTLRLSERGLVVFMRPDKTGGKGV
jgi:hypothetical protein